MRRELKLCKAHQSTTWDFFTLMKICLDWRVRKSADALLTGQKAAEI